MEVTTSPYVSANQSFSFVLYVMAHQYRDMSLYSVICFKNFKIGRKGGDLQRNMFYRYVSQYHFSNEKYLFQSNLAPYSHRLYVVTDPFGEQPTLPQTSCTPTSPRKLPHQMILSLHPLQRNCVIPQKWFYLFPWFHPTRICSLVHQPLRMGPGKVGPRVNDRWWLWALFGYCGWYPPESPGPT